MAQLPFIKQNQVSAGISKTRSNAVKVYCSEAIAANDILSVIGLDTSGTFLSVARADANGVVTLNSSQLFVADYAAALGDYSPVALPWKVVEGVNTVGRTIGDPVYLSNTPGSVLLPGGSLKVGTVLTVAASGTILLAPQGMIPADGIAIGPSTSMVAGAGANTDFELLQPAGTVLTDIGITLTTSFIGTSGNSVVTVGTAAGGAQICATTNWLSGATTNSGSIQIGSGSQGEGTASLVFIVEAPLYTASARVVHIRCAQNQAVTQGVARPYLKFVRL